MIRDRIGPGRRVASLALSGALALGATSLAEDGVLVGGETSHVVAPGDSLTRLGARYGIEPAVLARLNAISLDATLRPGLRLRVENPHIVPFPLDEGILVNVPQRLLFLFSAGRLEAWYPVGVGRADWQTSTGRFTVRAKIRNPTWHVPRSIQQEMRRRGQRVRTVVPPGPANPLGEHVLQLDGSPCEIHSTTAPASVYGFHSHGCVRLHAGDMRDLYGRIAPGAPVEVVYEPVLMARGEGGAVFLEVHPDAYRRAPAPRVAVERLASREGLAAELDDASVERMILAREGVARRVDRGAATRMMHPDQDEGRERSEDPPRRGGPP